MQQIHHTPFQKETYAAKKDYGENRVPHVLLSVPLLSSFQLASAAAARDSRRLKAVSS